MSAVVHIERQRAVEVYGDRSLTAIPIQQAICERLKQIPRHRALVVVPQISNVVRLTTGEPVPVEFRRPKLRMVAR